jgi:hypothetical protein
MKTGIQLHPPANSEERVSVVKYHRNISITSFFVFLALQPIVVVFSQPVFRGFLITHNDAPQPVGLLWTNDQSVAETSA